MSDVQLKMELNPSSVVEKRAPLFVAAQAMLDYQVLKDSNMFAPKADGFLRASGRIERPGVLSWNTPYARRQYYLDEEVKGTINYTTPMTMAKWFEYAKAKFNKQWTQIASKVFGGKAK